MTENRKGGLRSAYLLERIGQLLRAGEQAHGLFPVQWTALRYLLRANAFSRTPIALARYLNVTRGTVSQTLIALERKGLVARKPNARDKRSVTVELTDAGRELLQDDPVKLLADDVEAAVVGEDKGFEHLLEHILNRMIERAGARAFGICRTCRHFRENGGVTKDKPHRCDLLQTGLRAEQSDKICAEHEAA